MKFTAVSARVRPFIFFKIRQHKEQVRTEIDKFHFAYVFLSYPLDLPYVLC